MMVLRRKIGEAIRIGNDIKIVVQEVHNGQIVHFGIEAPTELAVRRLETQAENLATQSENASTQLSDDDHGASEGK